MKAKVPAENEELYDDLGNMIMLCQRLEDKQVPVPKISICDYEFFEKKASEKEELEL